MKPEKIKSVYLGNKEIETKTFVEIFDRDWRDKLKSDGLYCLRANNDLCVYRLGNFIFEVEKNGERFELHFRERHEMPPIL